MKILARQLAIDMYSCNKKYIAAPELSAEALSAALTTAGFTVCSNYKRFFEDGHFVIFMPLDEGHLSIQIYPELSYAAVDLFICEPDSLPEKAIRALRRAIKPEEIKMTYLCRGDFGTITDMKPHIKVKMTPLKRIKNTSVKVIHLLPGKNLIQKLRRNK